MSVRLQAAGVVIGRKVAAATFKAYLSVAIAVGLGAATASAQQSPPAAEADGADGVEAGGAAPEQRNAQLVLQRRQAGAQRRRRDAELAGRNRMVLRLAGEDEIGELPGFHA